MYIVIHVSDCGCCGHDETQIEYFDTHEEAKEVYKRYCQHSDEGNSCYQQVGMAKLSNVKYHN